MKRDFGNWCVERSPFGNNAQYWLRLWLILISSVSGVLALSPTGAQATDVKDYSSPSTDIRQSEIEKPATTVDEWLTQIAQTSVVQVTGVQANPTDKGVEVILQTTQGEQLQISDRSSGNNFIADIPNAQLRLSNGDAFTFRSQNPIEGINEITVTNLDANTIRVTIAGETRLPTVELFDSNEGLIFGLTPAVTAMQPPQQSTTPQETPAAQQDQPIEILVTGEQDTGYYVPDASTATRTNTPLRDIPQSIQVIPEQVIEDRNATELRDALETLGGIGSSGTRGTGANGETFKIRGFDVYNDGYLRDGIPYFSLGTLDTNDIERVEVLKGPASVIFGAVEPGGVINLVSKQPLFEPFYSASVTIGSFDTYRGAIDLSGPLNESRTVRYRLNTSYENYGSFRDFVNGERFSITPTLTWDISPNTSLNVYGQFITERETIDEGLPETSNGVVNIPRSRFLNEPFSEFRQDQFNVGYTLNHRFSEDWSVRHALQYLQYQPVREGPTFGFASGLNESTGELARLADYADGTYRRFFTNAEVIGNFSTGSVQHRLLFGTEYRYRNENPRFAFPDSDNYPSINVFNPIYTRTRFEPNFNIFRDDNISVVSVYLQDQVELLPNLKLLAGVRYDNFTQFRTQEFFPDPREEFEQTDSAWTPRFGIVYQPIEPISLYASYSRSFAPSFAGSRNADGSPFEPQTGQQFEVGLKADLSNQLSLTLAAFDLRRQNLSTPDPDNPAFSLQTGEQTSRGIELNLDGEILPGWNMTASYSYLDAFVSEDNTTPVGNRLPDVPENQFSLWTTYEIQNGDFEGLGLGLGLFYVGERQRDLDNTYTLPSYFRTDAALFYRRDNWRAQLNIENLFDIEYFRSGNYSFAGGGVNPGRPFAVSGTFSIEF
ncbi:TonB-dependent siderophore receptor [Gloeocapsa sp. PCC 7428]|uniref:TonB-dependent siderophore receptor n=1 Tax=Gloeocapsa sp. PCC 7428 TaxID=1173026 RepID=UPI0002A5CD67|nr:TonB-dependent siderophore receptor [Gloeocapsa sp. PCC 7428]AFZ29234.1 TonB-dependent siderophore receptor [Gloeocapsa sp. PCC 7428]